MIQVYLIKVIAVQDSWMRDISYTAPSPFLPVTEEESTLSVPSQGCTFFPRLMTSLYKSSWPSHTLLSLRRYCLLDYEFFRADWNSTPDVRHLYSVNARTLLWCSTPRRMPSLVVAPGYSMHADACNTDDVMYIYIKGLQNSIATGGSRESYVSNCGIRSSCQALPFGDVAVGPQTSTWLQAWVLWYVRVR